MKVGLSEVVDVAFGASGGVVESIGGCGVVWLQIGRGLARQEEVQEVRPDLPPQGLPPLME